MAVHYRSGHRARRRVTRTADHSSRVVQRVHGQPGAVVASAVLDFRFALNHGFDFYYNHFVRQAMNANHARTTFSDW